MAGAEVAHERKGEMFDAIVNLSNPRANVKNKRGTLGAMVELGHSEFAQLVLNMAGAASFERPGALATSQMSAMCRSTRSLVAMPRARADVGISPQSIRPSMSLAQRRASSRLWKLSLT